MSDENKNTEGENNAAEGGDVSLKPEIAIPESEAPERFQQRKNLP